MDTIALPEVPSATRLRSTQARLDNLASAAYVMQTAVSTNQARAAGATLQYDAIAGTLGDFANMSLLGQDSLDSRSSTSSTTDKGQEGQNVSQASLQVAMQQVDKLKSDIAGMEAVVAAVRGVARSSVEVFSDLFLRVL
jgi:hypothetical protein